MNYIYIWQILVSCFDNKFHTSSDLSIFIQIISYLFEGRRSLSTFYDILSTTKCNRLFIESTLVRYLDIVFTDENVVETFDIANDFIVNYPLSIDIYF